ncbi:MAG: type II toxin-antitoxin system VapC family toxin [Cyanobacteria bacterium J06581_3]
MIVLDTHIWIWWITQSPKLTDQMQVAINNNRSEGLGVSIFSCWEVAKLVEKQKLELSLPINDWIRTALQYPNVRLLDLTIPIIVKSTKLEGFHKDPADQIIVATAQIHDCPLLTIDRKIAAYSDVETVDLESE